MALAHDAPYARVPGWGKISLPEYMDWNRNGEGWSEDVRAWHITTKSNVAAIKATGLRTSSCARWMSNQAERPSAVYLFCARSVVEANIPALFDNPDDAAIIEVVIPAKYAGKLYNDNLYNMSVDVADMCAIQYRDSIPAEWIK